MKKITIFIAIVVIGVIIYLIAGSYNKSVAPKVDTATETATSTIKDNTASSTVENKNNPEQVIGKSVEGRDIVAYHFGHGKQVDQKEILFIGGIHGGYSWNTALVAFELMGYLKANPDTIPPNIKITVIPVLNPDGLYKVTGKEGNFSSSDVSSSQTKQVTARFNANTVDLNRNFDCDWQAEGVWQNKKVSGGGSAFSEPESKAIKNYVEKNKITAALSWYAAVGGVYASSCHNGVSSETTALTAEYANASGYKAYEDFNFYEITGDMMNWFAKNNISAISVLLTNHTDTDWSKNKAGIDAVLNFYK